jgi:hypothetical protein
MVGLIPLFAAATLEARDIEALPAFRRRMRWFLDHRPQFAASVAVMNVPGQDSRGLLSLVSPDRLGRVLAYMLDEDEFLSPFGVRALSRYHAHHPFSVIVGGTEHRVDYEPGESQTPLFGGNSNWRGPIWFPVNFLLIESLRTLHRYFGPEYRVEYPTGSGRSLTLDEIADEIAARLTSIFLPGADGRRPVFGGEDRFATDPHWRDLIPFHEYFHADTGKGIGASHLKLEIRNSRGAGLRRRASRSHARARPQGRAASHYEFPISNCPDQAPSPAGNRSVKTVSPGTLVTVALPPWRSMMARTIERPSPLPCRVAARDGSTL